MTKKEYTDFLASPIGVAIINYLTEFAQGDEVESRTILGKELGDLANNSIQAELLRKHYRAILGMRDDLLDATNFIKRIK